MRHFEGDSYSSGKGNSRRLREIAGVMRRRNWNVIRVQRMFMPGR